MTTDDNTLNAEWRKSTYSNGTGNCVEVTSWRKASYSNGTGACIEAGSTRGIILVRDTANRPGAVLAVSAVAWRSLLAEVRAS